MHKNFIQKKINVFVHCVGMRLGNSKFAIFSTCFDSFKIWGFKALKICNFLCCIQACCLQRKINISKNDVPKKTPPILTCFDTMTLFSLLKKLPWVWAERMSRFKAFRWAALKYEGKVTIISVTEIFYLLVPQQ